MFPIINSSIGCLYNSILQRSLWTGMMAPGDSSRASSTVVGSPQRLAHGSHKKNVMWIPQAHVRTHRASHSGDLLRWLLFWHRKCLSDTWADSIHRAGRRKMNCITTNSDFTTESCMLTFILASFDMSWRFRLEGEELFPAHPPHPIKYTFHPRFVEVTDHEKCRNFLLALPLECKKPWLVKSIIFCIEFLNMGGNYVCIKNMKKHAN